MNKHRHPKQSIHQNLSCSFNTTLPLYSLDAPLPSRSCPFSRTKGKPPILTTEQGYVCGDSQIRKNTYMHTVRKSRYL